MSTLKLHLCPTNGKGFKIIATTSGIGEGETESSLPFFEGDKDWRAPLLRCLEMTDFKSQHFPEDEQVWMIKSGLLDESRGFFSADYLKNIGKGLFQALFPADSKAKEALVTSLRFSQNENSQLHIQLSFSDEVSKGIRLADYPWELLHDGKYFLLHGNITISRYIAHANVPPNLPPTDKINVLLVSSAASDTELVLHKLGEDEASAIREGLSKARNDGHINLTELNLERREATRDKLRAYLTEHRGDDAPQVLHFDGHGVYGKRCPHCGAMNKGHKTTNCRKCNRQLHSAQGYLVFEDGKGGADYISAEELGVLLSKSTLSDGNQKSTGIALVVLSACQSGMTIEGDSLFNGIAQNLIGQRIPSVVAMQYSVSVASATKFAEQFYRSLGQKNSLGIAVSQAREAMGIEGNQWYRPVLYLRWLDNQGGQLFGDSSRISDVETSKSYVLQKEVKASKYKPESNFQEKNNLQLQPKPFLRRYPFEYAEVISSSRLLGFAKKPEIKYQRKEAKYFMEGLGGGVELEMINIPDGNFFMGSPEEQKPHKSEQPQHLVSINSFFIGKYPITQKQWKAVACLPQVNRSLVVDCSKFKGDNYPVEQVCWEDGVEFCHRLSQKTSRNYRLPSEAEWEYAARADTKTLFHFGDIITSKLAIYNYQTKFPTNNQTCGVDKFNSANAFGLYDMHGLVWEWCMDHWHDNYKKAPNDGKAWLKDRGSQYRVIRGGSWADISENCRSASRKKASIDEKTEFIGFRVVCGE